MVKKQSLMRVKIHLVYSSLREKYYLDTAITGADSKEVQRGTETSQDAPNICCSHCLNGW